MFLSFVGHHDDIMEEEYNLLTIDKFENISQEVWCVDSGHSNHGIQKRELSNNLDINHRSEF